MRELLSEMKYTFDSGFEMNIVDWEYLSVCDDYYRIYYFSVDRSFEFVVVCVEEHGLDTGEFADGIRVFTGNAVSSGGLRNLLIADGDSVFYCNDTSILMQIFDGIKELEKTICEWD